ncbi:hypothetical protein CLU79DRAFT_699872, partial [Phycomyces nitens]
PLLELSMFFIQQSPTLYSHSQPNHLTIRMLHRLVKESIEQCCTLSMTSFLLLLMSLPDDCPSIPSSQIFGTVFEAAWRAY